MPVVYDVAVRYSRKVQVVDYQPIEAEVSLKAQLTDNEDYEQAASKLMVSARNAVHDGLKNRAVGQVTQETTAERVAETKEVTKNKRGRPAKDKADDKTKSDDTFPEESGQSEKNTQTKTQSEPNDSTFPDDDDAGNGSDLDETAEVISIADLRDKFTGTVRDKSLGVSGADLKGLLQKYGVARCDQLEDTEQRAKVHAELLALIASKQK